MAALLRHVARKAVGASRSQLSAARDGWVGAAALLQQQQPFSHPHQHRSLYRRRHSTATNPTAAAAAAAHAGTASEEEEILQSIVKVFTVSSSPNFFMPWQNKTQSEKTGSGVVALLPLPDVPNGIGRVALTPGCQVGYTHTGCHQLLLSTIRLTSLLHSLPGVRLVHTGSLQLADLLVF
jgi:hypothetical protein